MGARRYLTVIVTVEGTPFSLMLWQLCVLTTLCALEGGGPPRASVVRSYLAVLTREGKQATVPGAGFVKFYYIYFVILVWMRVCLSVGVLYFSHLNLLRFFYPATLFVGLFVCLFETWFLYVACNPGAC